MSITSTGDAASLVHVLRPGVPTRDTRNTILYVGREMGTHRPISGPMCLPPDPRSPTV